MAFARVDNPTIIVAWCARCGTSLVMRMLDAAGIPVHAENRVSYEHPDADRIDYDGWTWLSDAVGKAVKVLAPPLTAKFVPTRGLYAPLEWIWIRRDPLQQARSHAKFMNAVAGVRFRPRDVRRLMEHIDRDTRSILTALERRRFPVLIMTFEDLVRRPAASAKRLLDWVCPAPSSFQREQIVAAMAAVVVKRSPDCLAGLLEYRLLEEEIGRAGGDLVGGAVPTGSSVDRSPARRQDRSVTAERKHQ